MALTRPLAAMVFDRPLAIASALLLTLVPVSAAQAGGEDWQEAPPPRAAASPPGEIRATAAPNPADQSSLLFLEVLYGLPLRNADGRFDATAPLYRGQFVSLTRLYLDRLLQRYEQSWQPYGQQCTDYTRRIQDVVDRFQELEAEAEDIFTTFDSRHGSPNGPGLGFQGEPLSTRDLPQEARAKSRPQALEVRDVAETDPYFLPLQWIMAGWDINLLYDDQTFRGENALTQGEWATYMTAFSHALEEFGVLGHPRDLEALQASIEPLLVPLEAQLEEATIALQELAAQMEAGSSSLPKAALSSSPGASPALTAQLHSIEQVMDVSAADPYFEDLRELIEVFGLDLTLEDDTFRGDTLLTRGDFVIYLSQIADLMAGIHPPHTACTGWWEGEAYLQSVQAALDELMAEIHARQRILTADTP